MKIKLFLLTSLFLTTPAMAQQGSITLYRNINSTLLRSSILLSKTATIPDDYAKSCPHRIIQRQTPIYLYQNLCKLCFENKVDLSKENKNKINNNKYFHCCVHLKGIPNQLNHSPDTRSNSWLDSLRKSRRHRDPAGLLRKHHSLCDRFASYYAKKIK
jgi:hypothetical protein